MKILVACEFSGIVRDAFIERGHTAVSCDLLPTERPGPHIQGDVRELFRLPWDMVIAHPPCNYLSHINEWMGNEKRYPDFMERCGEAIDFFMDCFNANAPRVAVENPQPSSYVSRFIGPPDDRVNPYQFGEPYRKRTWLWLRGLPPLMRTGVMEHAESWVHIARGKTHTDLANGKVGSHAGHERSRFWPGIAAAMALQWG